ncbi:hypothetical protein ARMGADRAFT_1034233 [Armillaria gallica]|uniref:Uncharacterized protein n=1 Tax=Armillaria gallica TaxID=47427 RepID=A0A2H3CZ59_ARMGA|nr:hypothetical protein ARMGADRAFT_1034233 [Armillaria gallica]
MTLDWIVIDNTCYPKVGVPCTNINIYFDINLLQRSDTNSSDPSSNKRAVDPVFIWNATALFLDPILSQYPTFQTKHAVFLPYNFMEYASIYASIYIAAVFAFATDASTNDPVKLHLNSTSGLAVFKRPQDQE